MSKKSDKTIKYVNQLDVTVYVKGVGPVAPGGEFELPADVAVKRRGIVPASLADKKEVSDNE